MPFSFFEKTNRISALVEGELPVNSVKCEALERVYREKCELGKHIYLRMDHRCSTTRRCIYYRKSVLHLPKGMFHVRLGKPQNK